MEFNIADGMRGFMSFYDLTGPCGILGQQVEVDSISRDGYLFRLSNEEFHLEIGMKNRDWHFRRNGESVVFPAIDGDKEGIYHTTYFCWTPNEIWIQAKGKKVVRKTKPTFVPASLIKQAKMQNIIPNDSFETLEEFRNCVHNIFSTLEDKIDETRSQEIYWNVEKKGGKIVGRRPKDEIEIQSNLHGLLYDQFMAKSIEVFPESPNSSGRLDFTLLAHVKNIGITKLAVEFKRAHSSKLEHGLLEQLPAYMRSIHSRYGIYCVLFFKSEWFDQPAKFSCKYAMEIDLNNLRCSSKTPEREQIRIFALDLGKRTSASS